MSEDLHAIIEEQKAIISPLRSEIYTYQVECEFLAKSLERCTDALEVVRKHYDDCIKIRDACLMRNEQVDKS